MIELENIFDNTNKRLAKELVETLASSSHMRVEKITTPASSTPSQVYDQNEGEFVMLVDGYAELELQKKTVTMGKGDYINIPPHSKHRILRNDKTIWLCVFYK